MKPRSPVYVGGPLLDPPDDPLLIRCTYCRIEFHSKAWRDNRGNCPGCCKPYAGKPSED